MTTESKILLIDDDESHAVIAGESLERVGYDVTLAHDGVSAIERYAEAEFDCVLTDLRLPDTNGMELLKRFKATDADVEVIIITGYGSVEKAVDALHAGAYSFLEKPLNIDALRNTVAKALERRKLSLANRELRSLIDDKFGYEGIIGSSSAMQTVFNRLKQISPTDARVLVTGENGTGKELVARALHFNSKRREGPLVAVNCGALTGGILDSELFGHVKGSFTGAHKDHKGKFEAADGGTLFLDEVGEMPLETQVRLLRVIEAQEVTPVGSNTPRKVDVRIVSATNKNLAEQIQKGEFREDLFFRLKVVEIHIPALRERTSDIPLLATAFMQEFASNYEKSLKGISHEAMAALVKHQWPGNVRELRNTLEEMVVLAGSEQLTAQDVPPQIQTTTAEPIRAKSSSDFPMLGKTMQEIEAEAIKLTLADNRGNRERTAKTLNIGERTLYRKLKEYGLT
ncbi:MAG: sigma-54 dependent transcriptional regulator [Planctomycetota bacterium]